MIDRDPEEHFFFGPLAELKNTLLSAEQLSFLANSDTVVVINEESEILIESDAAFYILSRLKSPIRIVGGLKLLPRSFRNFFYRLVAKNRYKIFGKNLSCAWAPEYQKRMLS